MFLFPAHTVNISIYPTRPLCTWEIVSRRRMELCPIFRLPPELRNCVYPYVLSQDETINIMLDRGTPRMKNTMRKDQPLALTATCRAIKDECRRLFYTVNNFRILWSAPYIALLRFRDKIVGWDVFSSTIRSITVEYDPKESGGRSPNRRSNYGTNRGGNCPMHTRVVELVRRTTAFSQSANWPCTFRFSAMVCCRSVRRCPDLCFNLDLDFSDLQQSWERNWRHAKQWKACLKARGARRACWRDMSNTLNMCQHVSLSRLDRPAWSAVYGNVLKKDGPQEVEGY